MSKQEFSALVLDQQSGNLTAGIRRLNEHMLPAGDVTVRIQASSLNYKDAMILKGMGRLVRNYPHIPGVDFAGVVEQSEHPHFAPGEDVLLTGWRVGETWWGGYSEKARVRGDWLVKRPQGLTASQTMAIGTAGFTAMLAVMALEKHGLGPENGDVLVTGAAGGVGGVAVAILAKVGCRVIACTGRSSEHDYLRSLGAAAIMDRSELSSAPARPLGSERWQAAVDVVGGSTLASVLASLRYGGSVSACGLAGGNELTTSVLPFLLRGVNLLGIDSVMCPMATREAAWNRLTHDLPLDKLDAMTSHVRLEDLPQLADRILQGQVRGRIVVDIDGTLAHEAH